ncbi:MAG: glycosyltransferase family 2 protein [Syntrophales bacterium]
MSKILSIIIVTYGSRSVIGDCLYSIEKWNDIDDGLQVIIVDNSPNLDTTFGYVKETFPWVELIKNEENRGFGQGNNVGVNRAVGQYLLFLNPDTILTEPIFRYAVDRFKEDPDLGLFGMLLVSSKGRYTKSFGFMPEMKGILPTILYMPLIIYFHLTPAGVFPWGANLFIRREEFLSIGGFDENIFICYEEPDLVRRLIRKKVKIFSRKIVHMGDHTTDNVERRLSLYLESEKYYFDKHNLDYQQYIRKALFTLKARQVLSRIFRIETDTISEYLIKAYRQQRDATP